MQENLVKAWLSLFWESFVFCLPDIENVKGINFWKNFSTESLLELNKDTPYWLFYVANGNIWKVNTVWDAVKRSNTNCERYVSAFYVDIDLKETEFNTLYDLQKDIIETIKERNLPVSYMVQSWWWFHLYMFVNPEQRYLIWNLWKYQELQEMFASFFKWWDKSANAIAKLIRLPFSNHWKTWTAKPVKLFKIEKDWPDIELEEVTDVSQITIPEYSVFNIEHIKNYIWSLTEVIDIRKNNKLQLPSTVWNDMDVVNQLPVETVIFKLKEYPREYMGKSYIFKTKHWFINFEITDPETWKTEYYHTDWYRVNEQLNFINNFSWDKYSIEERPRGSVYAFLYYYFYKDPNKIREFLEKEFNIKLSEATKDTVMPPIVAGKGSIVFTKGWVIYKKEMTTAKGKILQQDIPLFRTPFKIKWVMESNYTLFWEVSSPVKYYLIERLDKKDDNEFTIEFVEDRRKFNRMYWKTWLVFLWEESDLLDFYLAINYAVDAWQIQKYDLKYLNGLYDDYFLLWDIFIDKDFNIKNEWPHTVLKTQSVPVNLVWKNHISLWAFLELLTTLFSERIAYVSFFSYLTLFLWHNFWKPIKTYKQQYMIPWLIFSWKTKVGKSTLLSILKEWSWLTADSKRLSVLSSSPQPIKQSATDSFILHLEEFTGKIQPEKESIIRDIINKTNSSRWLPTGQNIEYNYRSSVILDWERLPTSNSVVNRCIVSAMFETDKKWSEDSLYSIREYMFLKDLITKAFTITDEDILSSYQKAENILSKKWFNGRQLLLYSFLLATNIIFKITDNNKVLSAIEDNINTLWEVVAEWDELTWLLSEIIINRRISPRLDSDFAYTDKWTIVIPVTSDIIAEKQIDFIAILRKYKWKITLMNHKIMIKFDRDVDEDLYNKVSQYSQYFRHNNL